MTDQIEGPTEVKTRTKKTTASGKGRKSSQAGSAAVKKQKSRPLTTADIVTAVVEALPPRENNTTARTQSSHGTGQRTKRTDRQPDQATDETTSLHGTVTRRETRSRHRQPSPVREQQDATNEEDSEDEDFGDS